MSPLPSPASEGDDPRLAKQLAFVREADKVKHILRQTHLLDGSRRENDAEHMWHLSLMAVVLAEYTQEPVDLKQVLKMLLIHDLVEIDAGDTFRYDEAGRQDQHQREAEAAERIFGLLPPDQARLLHGLWDEFEARQTAEARFAAALDRLQPLLHNYITEGRVWRKHAVTAPQVLDQNRHIAAASPRLWQYARQLIEESVRRGYLAP